MRRKLGIIAHSGVGKSALLKALRRDPRLAEKSIVELDSALPTWFDPTYANSIDMATSGNYWFWAKMSATHSALNEQRADIIAGLFAEGRIRAMLEARGFSLVVLSVPPDTHRARLQNRLRNTGSIPMDVERCVEGQQRLEGLGYELIDGDRPVDEIVAELAPRVLDEVGPEPAD